jgi:O-antigen ligase
LFDVPVVALCVSAAVTLGAVHDPKTAREAMAWLCGWGGLAILIGRISDHRRIWNLCATAVVLAAACVALYFIAQFSYLGVDPKVPALAAIGRLASSAVPRIGTWSPFSNSVATCLEGLMLFGVGLTLMPQTPAMRWVHVGATAVIAIALGLTMSRGAWLGVAAGGVTWVVVQTAARRVRPALALGALLVVLALGITMTWNGGLDGVARLAALAGSPFIRLDRLDIYHKSLSLLDDVGLTGLGPGGQYAMAFSKFALLIQVPFVTYPHQFTLHLWLAYGVAGLAAWVWWMSGCAALAATAERQRVTPAVRGAWCGIVAVLVHGLTDARQSVDPWTWGPLFVLCALVVGRHRRTNQTVPSRLLAVPFACVVLATAIGLWRAGPLEAAWHTSRRILDESKSAFGEGSVADKASLMDAAARHYDLAIAVEPSRVSAQRRLALLAADRNDFVKALKHARIALDGDGAGYATRRAAGLVAGWAGEFSLAQTLLEPTAETVEELRLWSFTWKSRGQLKAAENSQQLSLEIAAHLSPP